MASRPDSKINRWLRNLKFFKEDVGHGCVIVLASMDDGIFKESPPIAIAKFQRPQQWGDFYKLWPRSYDTGQPDFIGRMWQLYLPRVASVWRTARDKLESRALQPPRDKLRENLRRGNRGN